MSATLYVASLGVVRTNVPSVILRAQAMATGFSNYKADYPALNPSLTAFEGLLQSLVASQLVVPTRAIGATAARDVQRDLLWSAMKSEMAYAQSLVDANPSRAISLIENAGLVLVTRIPFQKPLLALSNTAQSGTIACVANIRQLVGTGTIKPYQKRCLEWQYTLDGGKTFLSAGSTPGCRTTIGNLSPQTLVGVRVCLTNMHSVGAWTQLVTIQVH